MEPFRLRLLKALTAALEEIRPVNHTHDMSGRVFRGRDLFGDDDPLPMLSILEAVDEKALVRPPDTSTTYRGPWELLIQGWVEADRRNPCDPAEYLLADVKQRLAQEMKRGGRENNILGMGGLVERLQISQGVVRPPDEVSSKAYFWLRVTLQIVENLADPYA